MEGKGFKIVNRHKFLIVLKERFFVNKLSSFFRELNMYSIKRMKNSHKDVFRHRYFRKDMEEDLIKVQRKVIDLSRQVHPLYQEKVKNDTNLTSKMIFLQQTRKSLLPITKDLTKYKNTITKRNLLLKRKSIWLKQQLDLLIKPN